MFGVLILSVVLAYLTYAVIDRPFRSRKPNLQLVLSLLVTLTVVVFGLVQMEKVTRKARLNSLPDTVLEVKKEKVHGSQKACRRLFGKGHTACWIKGQNPTTLVTGDSHAYWLWNAAKNSDKSIYLVGNAGGMNFENARIKGRKTLKHTEKIWKQIRTNDQIQTIVFVGYWHSYLNAMFSYKYKDKSRFEAFQLHWRDALSELKDLNKRVIIVLDNPRVSFNPIDRCFNLRQVSLMDRSTKYCKVLRSNVENEQQAVRQFFEKMAMDWSNVKLVDSLEALCDSEYCYMVENDNLLYRDGHHLSKRGAQKVWKLIEEAI